VGKPARRSSIATTISSTRCDAHEVARRAGGLRPGHLLAIAGRAQVADDAKAALVGAPAQPSRDERRAVARTPHEHPALEHFLVDQAQEEIARQREADQREAADQHADAASDVYGRSHVEDQREDHLGQRDREHQAHQHAGEGDALAQLVEPERGEAGEEHRGDQQRPRPDRPDRVLERHERRGEAAEAHEDRRDHGEQRHAAFDEREQREPMDVAPEQAHRDDALRKSRRNLLRVDSQRSPAQPSPSKSLRTLFFEYSWQPGAGCSPDFRPTGTGKTVSASRAPGNRSLLELIGYRVTEDV
jgi:hypothetical protein